MLVGSRALSLSPLRLQLNDIRNTDGNKALVTTCSDLARAVSPLTGTGGRPRGGQMTTVASAVWGLMCALLWQCDPPPPPLSTWQCNSQGSVTQNNVIVDVSVPCSWGLTEILRRAEVVTGTCAGAELLAAIERREVNRRNLQVVVVRHAEDISWSEPFTAVRTVYEKPGHELPVLTSTSAGVGEAAPDAASVVLPNVGREQHAILTHIVRNYDSLADMLPPPSPQHPSPSLPQSSPPDTSLPPPSLPPPTSSPPPSSPLPDTPPPSPTSPPPKPPPPLSPPPSPLPGLPDFDERLDGNNTEGAGEVALIIVLCILALLLCCACVLAGWRRRRLKQRHGASEADQVPHGSTSFTIGKFKFNRSGKLRPYEQDQFDPVVMSPLTRGNDRPGEAAHQSASIDASVSPPITLGSLDQPTAYSQRVQRARSGNLADTLGQSTQFL